jgi:hypothetical protein
MSTDLKQAATDVINQFNAGNYGSLEGGMDSNVIIKKVLHPGSVIGIGNVSGYLDKHMKSRNPQLTNSDKSLWNGQLTLIPPVPQNATATYGRASGSGYYVDDNGNSTTPINFTLDFVRNSTADDWSLSNAFATPTA